MLFLIYRFGAPTAAALEIYKAFDRVWQAGLLCKLKSYLIPVWVFGLTLSFFNNRWLGVILDGMFLEKYLVNNGVPQCSILGPTFFLLCINDLPDDVFLLVSMQMTPRFVLSVIRHLICGNTYSCWGGGWRGARRSLLISILEKLNLFHLTILVTLMALMWK